MALNINVMDANLLRCRRNDDSDWKIAAATVVAGAACYAGYKMAQKNFDGKNWSLGPSPSSVPLQQCAICWKKMKPRKHFSCVHSFHDTCIENQRQNNTQLCRVDKKGAPIYPTCPICKAKQVPDSEKDWEVLDEFDL